MSSVTQAHEGRGGPGRALTLSRCALLVLGGEQKGEQCVLEGDLLRIGKSPDNDLVLTDTTVSREHCEIVRDPKGYLLRDLGSTNGTLLEGAEVREGYLRPGAVITVGRIELQIRTYAERIELLPSERPRFGEMVGADPSVREIFGLLERVSASDATLLIGGETGTGKDVLARSVHAASKRKDGPFVAVDCGALVGSLIESELFGHEKGAFTGALERRQGAFELAQRGTLFLDEVGELPLELQPKLLRALETRRIRRVGGSSEIPVDIRVIAASNRNLALEVERGKFRQDLYFRLAVVPIQLPPLRQRRSDIAELAKHLLVRICAEHERDAAPLQLAPAALHALCAHDWPGNVRELRNVLERAVLLSRGSGASELAVAPLQLGPATVAWTAAAVASSAPGVLELDPALSYRENRARFEAEFERRYVRSLLDRHAGNVSAAAREAGMDRKYLHKLAVKHGVKK
jgi:transcriptional regulator with GAF, ATPase, and Fis domain